MTSRLGTLATRGQYKKDAHIHKDVKSRNPQIIDGHSLAFNVYLFQGVAPYCGQTFTTKIIMELLTIAVLE